MTDSTGTDRAGTDSTVPSEGGSPPAIRVLSGNPTATELAAVTSVLSALAEEEGGKRMPAAPTARSAWSISQRHLRRPIVPGAGAWARQDL